MAALYHAAECCRRAADEAAQRQAHDYHEQLALLVNVSEPDRTLAARSYDAYRRIALPTPSVRTLNLVRRATIPNDYPTLTDASAAGLEAAEIDHLRMARLSPHN